MHMNVFLRSAFIYETFDNLKNMARHLKKHGKYTSTHMILMLIFYIVIIFLKSKIYSNIIYFKG
jgi:hypothetical protein